MSEASEKLFEMIHEKGKIITDIADVINSSDSSQVAASGSVLSGGGAGSRGGGGGR